MPPAIHDRVRQLVNDRQEWFVAPEAAAEHAPSQKLRHAAAIPRCQPLTTADDGCQAIWRCCYCCCPHLGVGVLLKAGVQHGIGNLRKRTAGGREQEYY